MTEPVSVDEAKARLGLTSDHRDAEIASLVTAARMRVEQRSQHYLLSREIAEPLDRLCDPHQLASYPVNELVSVDYVDGAGAEVSIGNARIDLTATRVLLRPAVGSGWPTDVVSNLVARVRVGYAGETPAYPEDLKTAILLLVGHWFDNPVDASDRPLVPIPHGVDAICAEYRRPF